MAEELVLKASASPACRVIMAEISAYTSLTHVLPVLMHVKEERVATPESLSASLFPGLRPLCQKLLDGCCDDGTLERGEGGYVLTGEGDSVLEEGAAVERKKGAWKVYCLSHPLVPGSLRVPRITDGSREAVYNLDDPDPERLSYDIRGLKGENMTAVFGDLDRFRIERIYPYEKPLKPDARVTLRLVITPHGSSVFLDAPGWSDKGMLIRESDLAYEGAWEQLLKQNGISGWDKDNDRLAVSYHDVEMDERVAMKKTLEIEPELLGCRFERLKRSVSIFPQSQYDAKRWADDLFKDGTRGYLTSERCGELEEEIRRRLPDFEIPPVDRAKYLDEYERGTPEFWYVQAAEDWDL